MTRVIILHTTEPSQPRCWRRKRIMQQPPWNHHPSR